MTTCFPVGKAPPSTGTGGAETASPSSLSTTGLRGAFHIGVLVWVSVLLLGCLVIRAGEAVNSAIEIDEFHFLHSAWMVAHGYLPYRDFWTNHSPLLFFYVLKPLVSHNDGNPSLIPVARLLALFFNLGLFGLVAAIAARQQSWTAGLFASLFVSVNVTIFGATVRVRHDSLTLFCELLALILFARGVRSGRSRDALAAGAALGIALALTPKGLFGLSGLVIGYLVHQVSSFPRIEHCRALMRQARPLVALVAGSLGTFGFVLGALVPLDVWPLMVRRVFLDSLSSPDRFSPFTGYLLREIRAEPTAWLVMLGGFGLAARQWWSGSSRRDPGETLLLVAGLWFGVTYLFLMSSPYRQSALPFIAVLSIFGGRLLAMAYARLVNPASRTKAVAVATCLALLVGGVAIGSARSILPRDRPFRRINARQIQIMQYVLTLTSPEDVVFDGESAYIFRPQASYYGTLMNTILRRIRNGELDFDIPERCERLGCKVVIADDRVVRLPQTVRAWIRDNYIPAPVFRHVLLHRSLASRAGILGGQGSGRSP